MGTVILWDGNEYFSGYPSRKHYSSGFYKRMGAEERIIAKGNVFEGIEAKW